MESLKWVDSTYVDKHKTDDPRTLRAMYYPHLAMYSTKGSAGVSKPIPEAIMQFLRRYGRKVGMLLGVYILSLVPGLGRFVMPLASVYSLQNFVGTTPAAVIFGTGLLLPKHYLVRFLHTYFASRSLMRELVSHYFHIRIAAPLTSYLVGALFLPHQVHARSETPMVCRSRRGLVRLRFRFYGGLEDPVHRRSDVWRRRGFYRISHYQDHRPSTRSQ